jgi:hypothetical protein
MLTNVDDPLDDQANHPTRESIVLVRDHDPLGRVVCQTPAVTAIGPASSGDPAGGWFGRWGVGDDGLTRFEVHPTRAERDLVVPPGGVAECWHNVGNEDLTATAHAGGWVTLWATSRGMVRLTGAGSGWGLRGREARGLGCRFGPGLAEWRMEGDAWEIRRRVATSPGGGPVAIIDVEITGPPHHATYEERWVAEPRHLLIGGLMTPYHPPPRASSSTDAAVWRAVYATSALSRRATDAARTLASIGLYRRPAEGAHGSLVLVPRAPSGCRDRDVPPAPSWLDRTLPHVVVVPLEAGGQTVEVDPDAATLRVRTGPGDHHLRFAVVIADDPTEIDALVARAVAADRGRAAAWGGLLRLQGTGDVALEREAAWHATQLVSARQPDAHLGRRYVSQGSAYGFVHALQGAPRDYALFAVPMALFDPEAALDLLRVMMQMTTPEGAIAYAHTGRGMTTSGGIHAAPTDLPIWLLWALTEVIWMTGRRDLLDERIPFWPASDPDGEQASTVRDRVELAFRRLVEKIGLGPHGMVRVGSGDWADPISAMVGDRRAFHRTGESGFNTAFAAHALPRAADLVAPDLPGLAAEMRARGQQLREAMAAAWNGEWFLRGWDGRGGPVGDRHLFLDGQVWPLVAGIGPDEDRAALCRRIADRCWASSPIGATILDRPHPVHLGMLAPGWDCNGGVWAAIGGLLTVGLARHDPGLARESLHRQTFAAHAAAYPHVWYGIWSGPDAYNSEMGEQPGETFVQPATPMTEYPVMNANAHAGPLLALLGALGIEATPDGPVRHDRGVLSGATLTTPTHSFPAS